MCGFYACTTLPSWKAHGKKAHGMKEGSLVIFQRLDISLWREDVDGDDGLGFRWDFARGRWVMGFGIVCEKSVMVVSGRKL